MRAVAAEEQQATDRGGRAWWSGRNASCSTAGLLGSTLEYWTPARAARTVATRFEHCRCTWHGSCQDRRCCGQVRTAAANTPAAGARCSLRVRGTGVGGWSAYRFAPEIIVVVDTLRATAIVGADAQRRPGRARHGPPNDGCTSPDSVRAGDGERSATFVADVAPVSVDAGRARLRRARNADRRAGDDTVTIRAHGADREAVSEGDRDRLVRCEPGTVDA